MTLETFTDKLSEMQQKGWVEPNGEGGFRITPLGLREYLKEKALRDFDTSVQQIIQTPKPWWKFW